MESFHPSLMLQEYPTLQRREPQDDVHYSSFQCSMDTTIKHFSAQGTPEQSSQDFPLKSMDIIPQGHQPLQLRYIAAMIPLVLILH
jgi:hypothetical protein